MDSVRNATFRIGFPPPYVSLRSIRCKSLDRHMAASSILKWQNSLQEGKSLSRYNAASFYPEMAILTSSWNFVFNWIFDKLVPGDRLARGPIIRTVHAVLFEGLFMIATVPIIMYMMQMTFWMAFMTDITMTLVILGYTYVYNWVYDRARLYFVEA